MGAMYLLPLVVGLGATLAVALFGLLLRSWSTPRSCPDCGARTAPLERRIRMPVRLERRWCGHCGWTGSGRAGPRFDPDLGPSAHDSGFRWSRSRRRGAHFLWHPDRPTDTPSSEGGPGFEWAHEAREAERRRSEPVDPVPMLPFRWGAPRPRGFRFRAPEEEAARLED